MTATGERYEGAAIDLEMADCGTGVLGGGMWTPSNVAKWKHQWESSQQTVEG